MCIDMKVLNTTDTIHVQAMRKIHTDCINFFWFMQFYWIKINQLLAELLVDHSSLDNLHHLFSDILNRVLEDRLTNSSKPPNTLNESFKMFWDPILEYKGWLTSNFHSP